MNNYVSYENFSNSHKSFMTKLIKTQDPTSFKEEAKNEIWITAMNHELEALKKNKTWNIMTLPIGKRPIGCKWIFKTKRNPDGTINNHKARLVAKGYTQLQGIDYNEMFAPVSKMTTLRTVLSMANTRGWYIHQMDVQNAFLHGNLDEEIYMAIPQGIGHISHEIKNPVCKLNKSLYGLKQASRIWYRKLS